MTIVDDRTEPPLSGDDRVLLSTFLDWHRETLQYKCADLAPAQLATAAVPPSGLSLLGLVRHLTEVEAVWFQRLLGHVAEPIYSSTADPDGDFHVGDPAAVDQAQVDETWRRWQAAVAESRQIAARSDLDAISGPDRRGRQVSLRWILVHLVEEYARHNGHADLLREALDGRTGE